MGTDPCSPDTNGDGVSDSDSVQLGIAPWRPGRAGPLRPDGPFWLLQSRCSSSVATPRPGRVRRHRGGRGSDLWRAVELASGDGRRPNTPDRARSS
jgi:hypothetical protein